MSKEIYGALQKVKQYAENMLTVLENGQESAEVFAGRAVSLTQLITALQKIVPDVLYEKYCDFFTSFGNFCNQCANTEFLIANVDNMAESLALFEECMETLQDEYQARNKICTCCGKEVIYLPLPAYYEEMKRKYGFSMEVRGETINKEEYLCPNCGASDRDRFIVSFLDRIGLADTCRRESLLQIAPAKSIEHWLHANCPALTYHSTDLFMEGVTFNSDIQDMNQVADESYDYFICSHVLEHVQDDRKAMRELFRILKQDGMGIFLVPLFLGEEYTDEEWGLSEEENWKRFGQGDHCRRYAKQDLLNRLHEAGFVVHELGKDFFGPEVFEACGLTDTSTLYVLVKEQGAMEELISRKQNKWRNIPMEQPLVSVILPTYNHENYVEEAIESVLNQTYKNIEFLVADDGSLDGTPQKILQYEGKIDQIHLFEENTEAKIIQFLRERATGKYIAMMHSDDVWAPEKIELQVAYMESHPECGACFTGCECMDENGKLLGNKYFLVANKKQEEWLRFFFEYGNCLAHPSILIHRDLYLDFYTEKSARMFWQLPDYWLWINLVQKKEIHIIEKELTYFREHLSGQNKNTSAPTAENRTRHTIEATYIRYWTMKNMENEMFLKTFRDLLIDKNVSDEKEILCEKFFVLMKLKEQLLEPTVAFFMYDICMVPGVLQILEEKYQWTRKEMRQFTGSLRG